MAVIFIEGFDHMQAALFASKAWVGVPNSMQTGRFSGQAARINTNATTSTANVHTLPSTYVTLFAGFAFKPVTAIVPATVDIFILRASGNALRLAVTGSGLLQVRNSGGTVIATGTTPLPGNNWSYIEIKGFINGASGTCEVHLNGNTEIASTVGNFGSSNFDGISYAYASNSSGVGVNGDFDDIYVADTSGSAPRNTFLGDTRVETLYPSADGANQAWTPNSGSPHFSRVNEHTSTFPDDDTSYVSDLNSGDRDTYVCDDLSVVTGNVFAVQTNLYARKDDAGLRQVTPVIHQGGVDYDGNTLTLGSNYAVLQQIYNQDPTSADWTPANVNADEFGIKVV